MIGALSLLWWVGGDVVGPPDAGTLPDRCAGNRSLQSTESGFASTQRRRAQEGSVGSPYDFAHLPVEEQHHPSLLQHAPSLLEVQ